MSREDVLLDVTVGNGQRVRFEMFTHAPLLTMSLHKLRLKSKGPATAVVNVVEARQMRAALDEFIGIIEDEGGDPRVEAEGVAP